MAWDEKLFKKAYDFFHRKFREQDPMDLDSTAKLEQMKGRLTLLARALTKEDIEIVTASHEGGWKGHVFFMPAYYAKLPVLQENEQYFIFRVFYLATQKQLGLNWGEKLNYTVEASRYQAAMTSSQVLKVLFRNYQNLKEVYVKLLEAERAHQEQARGKSERNYNLLWGRWMRPLDTTVNFTKTRENKGAKKKNEPEKPITVIKAAAQEEVKNIEVDQQALEDFTLQHQFEKVETVEEFQGIWRDMDGDDDLADHEEALKEVNMNQTVRVDQAVHSVYQTEFMENSTVFEMVEGENAAFSIAYDEWDYKKQAYKKDYCKVYPLHHDVLAPEFVAKVLKDNHKTLQDLRKRFAQVQNERQKVEKQVDGQELDFDALVDNFAERKAGRTPTERVYLGKRKKSKSLSVILLLDVSLSTDAYTDGMHILSIEKQATLLFGQMLAEYDARFQVDTFSSRTRNHCDYTTVKKFAEDWSKASQRLGSVKAQGYTRIGPALRHAKVLLEKEAAEHKWIILLSDGKPNDYDRYEGRYGMEDVKQALRECRQEQVQVHALAIEQEAKFYLPQMFGHGAYQILPQVKELPNALGEFYLRLIK